MSTYNKAIASIVGGIIAMGVTAGVMPEEWKSPEVIAGLTTLIGTIFVYFSPKNAD